MQRTALLMNARLYKIVSFIPRNMAEKTVVNTHKGPEDFPFKYNILFDKIEA